MIQTRDGIDFPKIATPSNPPSGQIYLYFKADGNLYSLNSSGTETQMNGGGGGVPISIINTSTYILAQTPTAGLLAYATDLSQLMIADGTTWYIDTSYQIPETTTPDLGYLPHGGNRIGYGQTYVDEKELDQCYLGANSQTNQGGLRLNLTGNNGQPSGQIYLSGIWQNFVTGLSLGEDNGKLTDTPFGYTIDVYSGNSTILGLNGLPIVQNYECDMGAYPTASILNGGSF